MKNKSIPDIVYLGVDIGQILFISSALIRAVNLYSGQG